MENFQLIPIQDHSEYDTDLILQIHEHFNIHQRRCCTSTPNQSRTIKENNWRMRGVFNSFKMNPKESITSAANVKNFQLLVFSNCSLQKFQNTDRWTALFHYFWLEATTSIIRKIFKYLAKTLYLTNRGKWYPYDSARFYFQGNEFQVETLNPIYDSVSTLQPLSVFLWIYIYREGSSSRMPYQVLQPLNSHYLNEFHYRWLEISVI